jgi:hypothetical protein
MLSYMGKLVEVLLSLIVYLGGIRSSMIPVPLGDIDLVGVNTIDSVFVDIYAPTTLLLESNWTLEGSKVPDKMVGGVTSEVWALSEAQY